jgi:hypothetical protein
VPDDDNFNVRTEVNDLAIRYAKLPDGPDKETAFLKLVECFHGYLIKYTNMVIRGQLPNPTSRVGKDAAEMLKKLLPRGSNPDQTILSKTCHTLHLAFKTMSTDDNRRIAADIRPPSIQDSTLYKIEPSKWYKTQVADNAIGYLT